MLDVHYSENLSEVVLKSISLVLKKINISKKKRSGTQVGMRGYMRSWIFVMKTLTEQQSR